MGGMVLREDSQWLNRAERVETAEASIPVPCTAAILERKLFQM